MTATILLVEDEVTQRLMISKVLEKQGGHFVQGVGNGKEALFTLSKPEFVANLVVLDVNMPEMGGIETLESIKQLYPNLPVIMLSGSEESDDIIKAMKLGAVDFLKKPADPHELIITVRNALKLSALSKEVIRLSRQQEGEMRFEDLIGYDGGMVQTVSLGRKAAATDIPVLITGETGVGKEIFAKAIHGESPRAGKPFVAVNCGAIPEKLVESTLFGHEKGAFTGATDKALGKFREAEGGTILLDEVGELPIEAQVKLLRVLQQKEVEPVGGKKPVPVDVRIISATNRLLEEEVRSGNFREDLFFRLHVLPVHIPPLRARLQDIEKLAAHFIDRFTTQHQLSTLGLAADAVDLLSKHHWSGNVRELENLLHRACVVSDEERLSAQTLLPMIQQGFSLNKADETAPTIGGIRLMDKSGNLKTMEEVEAETLHYALVHYGDNIPKAAKALGLAKSTFYRKLKQIG